MDGTFSRFSVAIYLKYFFLVLFKSMLTWYNALLISFVIQFWTMRYAFHVFKVVNVDVISASGRPFP